MKIVSDLRMLSSASIIALSFGSIAPAFAQSLTGTITDASNDAKFEGAVVTIEELGRTTTTNRYGQYSINNIPTGTYTVTVDYVGADLVSSSVTIPTNGTTQNFIIGDDVAYIDNVIVVGTRAAQAGAINQQRASNSIISVIDSDGLGSFPDTTVADSLQRAPGISIETDQGEGRYVSIRGINPDLISASINGVRTPSPEDRRGVLLDGVPSDLLEGIEIQKSLTPDVDADSIGGVINLKTISAFDRNGQFIRVKAEGRYNEISEEISPKGAITYSNVFGDKLGVAVSGNFQSVAIEAHNNEAGGWGEEDGLFYINDDYESRWYDLTRERLGLVGNIDFKASDTTTLYLRSLYNEYKDDEVRNKFEYRAFDDTFEDAFEDLYEEADDGLIAAFNQDPDTELASPISSTQSQVALNEVDAEVRVREEIRQIQTYAVGGVTETGSWTVEYEGAYAFAEENDTNNHDVTFRAGDIQTELGATPDTPLFLTIDTSEPEIPLLSNSTILDYIFDPANYELDEIEEEKTINKDEEFSAKLDISKDSLLGDKPVTWKVGGKYRDREKSRDVNKVFHSGDDISLSEFASDIFLDNWRLSNPTPAFPDPDLTLALRNGADARLEDEDEDTFLDSNIEDFVVEEKILAGYVMGTFDLGKLTAVAGVRVEQTDVDMIGNIVEEEDANGDPFSTQVNFSDSYTNWLPSLNLKYNATDKVIGRAAYYKAIVRPAFGEMAPFAIVNDDRDEVELGNPLLEPYEADNFDIGVEFYPTDLSVISIGGFYKSIENAIFPAEVGLEDVATVLVPQDLDDEAEFASFINVEDSSILGVEFNLVQDLSVLSEALDGFLFSGNLTLSDAEATLPDGRETPFLRQSDVVWNAALGYDKGPWDLRVSANYRDDALDELVDEDFDRIQDGRLLIEASAKYKINDQFQIYVEGKNLTDAPEYYYFGDSSRLSQYDEFGRTFIFGGRYTY